ncbi:MAG: hypothetical protein IJI78_04820 [Oscillospiraceae bacterium]|nr:hypothetical protein [Oscillospiraceae bacterium]
MIRLFRSFALFLAILLVFSLCSCGNPPEAPSSPEGTTQTPDVAPVAPPSNGGSGPTDPYEDTEPEYVEPIPKTKLSFTYNDLLEGTLAPKGTARLMIIPINLDGGAFFDQTFMNALELRMNGTSDQTYNVYSVRDFFRTASYGQFDITYEVMSTYRPQVTVAQWDAGKDQYIYDYMYAAYRHALDNDSGSYKRFDSDGDDCIDGVIFVINAPEDSTPVGAGFRLKTYSWDLANFTGYPPFKYASMIKISEIAIDENGYYSDNNLTSMVGHAFGLEPYYDSMGMINPISSFDMQSGKMGDWNSFSKMSVGWLDPYVITPDTDSVTLKLRCSAEYGDAILIPAGDEWNGTPFDEYFLVDVFAGRGNNAKCWDFYAEGPNLRGGVRLLHVDAKMVGIDYYGNYTGYITDFENPIKGNPSTVVAAYSNTYRTDTSNDPICSEMNADMHFLTWIPAHGSIEAGYDLNTEWLFALGETFSTYNYSTEYFPYFPYMDHWTICDYEFRVDSYDAEKAEAVVTVYRVDN